MKTCNIPRCQQPAMLYSNKSSPSIAHYIKQPQAASEHAGEYRGHFFSIETEPHGLCRHQFNMEPLELKKLRGSVNDAVFKDLYTTLKYGNLRGNAIIHFHEKRKCLVVSMNEKLKHCEAIIRCHGIGIAPEGLNPRGEELLMQL